MVRVDEQRLGGVAEVGGEEVVGGGEVVAGWQDEPAVRKLPLLVDELEGGFELLGPVRDGGALVEQGCTPVVVEGGVHDEPRGVER